MGMDIELDGDVFYGIIGTFGEGTVNSGINEHGGLSAQALQAAIPFGGYFRVKRDAKEGIGQLVDGYGASEIKGVLDLDNGTFVFDKRYDGRNDVVRFTFSKENDLWLGDWRIVRTGGSATCQINTTGYELFQSTINNYSGRSLEELSQIAKEAIR